MPKIKKPIFIFAQVVKGKLCLEDLRFFSYPFVEFIFQYLWLFLGKTLDSFFVSYLPTEPALNLTRLFLSHNEGDCWDVRQCFVRQLFGFSSTIQE